jgi:hypothetical protein
MNKIIQYAIIVVMKKLQFVQVVNLLDIVQMHVKNYIGDNIKNYAKNFFKKNIIFENIFNKYIHNKMGFFSFITNDSKRSVIIGQKVNIYLIDNRGNVYIEEQYDGYGKFGEKDIFILFAEMNNFTVDDIDGETDDDYIDRLRSYAIDKWYHSNNLSQLKIGDSIEWFPNDEYIYPNVVENSKSKWVNNMPKDCPDQGAWP